MNANPISTEVEVGITASRSSDVGAPTNIKSVAGSKCSCPLWSMVTLIHQAHAEAKQTTKPYANTNKRTMRIEKERLTKSSGRAQMHAARLAGVQHPISISCAWHWLLHGPLQRTLAVTGTPVIRLNYQGCRGAVPV